MTAFATVVALETAILAGASMERRASPLGTTLHHPGLPDAYMVNQLVADPIGVAAAGGDGVSRLLDDDYAGSGHRRVWIPDALAGAALRDELVAAHFKPEETVVLVLAGEPPATGGPAREVDRTTIRAVERAVLEDEGTAPALVDQLLGLRDACASAAAVRHVVAADGDTDAGHATVYARDGAAKVEDVATLTAHRERGLARSVVALGTRLALEDGADPVAILADPDDWPAGFYRRLGFEEVGRWWSFTRRP